MNIQLIETVTNVDLGERRRVDAPFHRTLKVFRFGGPLGSSETNGM